MFQKTKRSAKIKLFLSNQFEVIKGQIKIEDDYFQAIEHQQMSEHKEILDIELRKLQKKMQAIDDRILNEKKCMKEAKRIFLTYTETIDQHVDIWDSIYSRDLGVIDREIMSLEHEENHWNELYEEFQEKVDQIQALINEYETRKFERELKNPANFQ